ncbi:Uncharacterised protein [Mycobacteroides abscessus subsp. abscessus]|nr:Uncharacterised protein [Mycobacteroides abscessus subsp. abscessus]SHV90275.1 Uncharacterised protein [Mycobacteroides abscessus subsp. abscessus]SHW50619.1 Uncharacterised protein [Mycobacteroides abscessus subsp. abscessus]
MVCSIFASLGRWDTPEFLVRNPKTSASISRAATTAAGASQPGTLRLRSG